ncbi:DUF5777 family beta-barrel protein [Owenweeksia hongkongensis]|uniref:DUF5777 family beta-barrel protein n=1 Tax=Owenweeksia hongkongensis TaxID=253245 RepID=UPI003A8DFC2A
MRKNKNFKRILIMGAFFFTVGQAQGQDDLLNMLEEEQGETTDYAFATFKGTRAINLQSSELPSKGVLQYIFMHRFGSFSDDFFYNNLGMNTAEVALQLDYGFTDWLNAGVFSGTAYPRTYTGFLKYRIFRQSKGAKNMPFSVVGYSAMTYNNERYPDVQFNESDRFSFTNQLILARKFTQRFSLEIVPTHVHFNIVSRESESNDIFSVGTAARFKITKQLSLSAEYIAQINPLTTNITRLGPDIEDQKNYNALSVGVDIETGGHVFQIFLTNSRGVADPFTIAQTPGSWENGDIHIGFNISRVFTIVKPKLPQEG